MRIFMTDLTRQPDWRRVIQALGPLDRVIIRDYQHPDRGQLAADIQNFCGQLRRPPALSIAADIGLARRLNMDLHLPQWALATSRPAGAGRPRLISTSAHNIREIYRAAQYGAHWVLISPVFATNSHPKAKALGPTRFAMLAKSAQNLGLRPIALGGIHGTNYRQLRPALGPFPDLAAIDGIATLPSLYI